MSSDNGNGESCSDTNSNQNTGPGDDSDDDYDRKSDNAVDYSDINELADDLQHLMQSASQPSNAISGDDYDLEDAIPASKVSAENIVQKISPSGSSESNNSQRKLNSFLTK